MTGLHSVIARYQVKVIPVSTDYEVGSLVPGLNLQGDILGLRICCLHKPGQYIGVAKASQPCALCKGTCDGEKHHRNKYTGNQFLHNAYPFHNYMRPVFIETGHSYYNV